MKNMGFLGRRYETASRMRVVGNDKIAQLAPFPGQGGAMHLLVAYTCACILSFVSGLPRSREVVRMEAVTALVKRLQLWFLDSVDTSRAGIITIAAIPVMKGLADKLKWELKQSQYRVAEWPVGDRLETHWNEFLAEGLDEMFAISGQLEATPDRDSFAIMFKGAKAGYVMQLKEYVSNPWAEPRAGSAFLVPPEVTRQLAFLKSRMDDILKLRKWKLLPSWRTDFVAIQSQRLRLAHEVLAHFFVVTSNEAHVECTNRVITMNKTAGRARLE